MSDLLGPANAPNAVTSRPADARVFGADDTWMQGCTSPDLDDGTEIQADFLNGLLAQVRRAIRGQGVGVVNADDDMLLKAIRSAGVRYAVDTGTANAMVVTNAIPITAYNDGFLQLVKKSAVNTDALVCNIDGVGSKGVVHPDGQPLAPGEWPASAVGLLAYAGGQLQLLTVFQSQLAQQFGQCYLSKSGANIVLKPHNGRFIFVDGVFRPLPAGGVTAAPTGLEANTRYYVYAKWNSGTAAVELEFSPTTHVLDASGAEVMSGNSSRTLVGMVHVLAGPAFADEGANVLVASWFNRKSKTAKNYFGAATVETSSSTLVELSTTIRVMFLAWADDDVQFNVNGECYNKTVNNCGVVTAVAIDGVVAPELSAIATGNLAGAGQPLCIGGRKRVSEGVHTATLFGTAQVNGVDPSTAAWYGLTGPYNSHAATYLLVSIKG